MSFSKIKIAAIFCFIVFPFFINEAIAQVPPPQPGETFVPVDGLGFLVAAGILYGVRKLMMKRK